MYIVAVDPGKATGVVVAEVTFKGKKDIHEDDAYVAMFGFHEITVLATYTVQMEDAPSTFRMIFEGMIPGDAPLLVPCEIFTVSRITLATQDHQSLEVIGMLKSVLSEVDRMPALKMQPVAEAKMMFPNARLKQYGLLGMSTRGVSDHVKDAMRHTALCTFKWVHGKVETHVPTTGAA